MNVFDEPLQRSYGQLRSLARLAKQADADYENNPAADGNFTPEDSWKTMVYPPPKGADQYRSSVRWEMTREGLEDYEWFLLLRDALLRSGMGAARARDEVSPLLQQVIRPDWSRVDDPQLMERIRSQIAAQIEASRTP